MTGEEKSAFKRTRWLWLKNPWNLARQERRRLSALCRRNQPIVRAYYLKEAFQRFWDYKSPGWSAPYLEQWLRWAMRSRLQPFQRFARMIREHLDGERSHIFSAQPYRIDPSRPLLDCLSGPASQSSSMPRRARVVLPEHPHHVIQRGHNRNSVFAEPADFKFYVETLAEWKKNLGCKVYAFCLMTNHVHLVIDPGHEADNLALLMKRVAGRYTRYVNRIERGSGTVWNGRYKSSPIETDSYLMACCRYVELNPVRARIVSAPEHYPWSSYRHKIGHARVRWLDEDPCYASLGEQRSERESRYREWVAATVPNGEWQLIRQAVQRGQLSGGLRFREEVQRRLGVRVESRGPGRPAHAPGKTDK